MKYINRTLERKFLSMNSVFKAVMVVGARQIGKSTMLKHLAENQNRTYVSMDDSTDRELAERDPKLFFQIYKPPILIDEVQKAPNLFEEIKIICDGSDERGMFWLTGSQSNKLIKKAGDSLSGRICVLKMFSLSQREKLEIATDSELDFSFEALASRGEGIKKNDILDVFSNIWDGGMPDMLNMDIEQRSEYWNSYIETYLMRDAVDDNGISDTMSFRKFLRATAAFSGHLINYNDIAQASGISAVTAKEWTKVLQSMGIIFLLEPYHNNSLKRLIKKPKLYFCDTGLCAYLSSWTSRDSLMNGAKAGHIFENYVVSEIFRSIEYGKQKMQMYFYRDSNQKEIDLLIESDGKIHPLEIKLSANPDIRTTKVFKVLERTDREVGPGGIICMIEEPYPIDGNNCYIPSNII